MTSREDVAREAGVSGATVSYVLNDTPGVSISVATREAVMAAAQKLGYRPSLAGRALKNGRLHQIGVLGPQGDTLFEAYHEDILRGIWRETSRQGYGMIVDAIGPDGRVRFAEQRIADAVIMLPAVPAAFPPPLRNRFRQLGVPLAMIGGGSWLRDFHTLDIDNVALGQAAAAYLLARGHRRVLFFGGRQVSPPCRKRRRGFRRGLREGGVVLREADVFDTATADIDEGYEQGLRLLSHPLRHTAAFCYNDKLALGLMRAAWDKGIEVPARLSLLGVDAAPIGQYTPMRLASFRQPLRTMGEEAVRLVLASPPTRVHRYFDFELVEGDTVEDLQEERATGPIEAGEGAGPARGSGLPDASAGQGSRLRRLPGTSCPA